MNRREQAKSALEARLGHVFADRGLLEQALTHASVGAGAAKPADNERLEFLGDRVLGLVIAEALSELEPGASVGSLSKRLHTLVSGETCAAVAGKLGVGAALRLPHGETKRGARAQPAILADACEALIAAVYLEAGFEAARRAVLHLWAPLIAARHDPAEVDPKSALQEWAAAKKFPAPAYRLLSRTGPDHQPEFTLEARVGEITPEVACAGSVRAAEKAAALALLRRVRSAS
ncbi:MAG TPA: ribonuclease III [Caulobacteraceae bacterium]|jgi:ribonuclease-3|nr:ribonuclease III [Caulobacteraceae bacterium]